jgi:hypothetical protein
VGLPLPSMDRPFALSSFGERVRHRGQRAHYSARATGSGISLQASPLYVGPSLPHVTTSKRGLQRGLEGRSRTVILFLDETILTETPPLRAAWALEGEQAEIPITGNRDKRVLFGVLNPRSGAVLLHSAEAWNQGEFQDVLSQTRSR